MAWKKHSQLKYLFVVWLLVDISFFIVVIVADIFGIYMTLIANGENSNDESMNSEDCNDKLVKISFAVFFGVIGLLMVIISLPCLITGYKMMVDDANQQLHYTQRRQAHHHTHGYCSSDAYYYGGSSNDYDNGSCGGGDYDCGGDSGGGDCGGDSGGGDCGDCGGCD